MKPRIVAAAILMTCSGALGAGKSSQHPLMNSDTVVWAGLDYSLVRMIGPGEFNDPAAIFPGMLDAWNDLFLRERVGRVETALKKRLVLDVAGVKQLNHTTNTNQVVAVPGPEDRVETTHITAADLAAVVKSYQLEAKSGLGLVFVADRFVKVNKKGRGAMYVVFFDVATREVIASERGVFPAAGFGFRNYWFRIPKEAEALLKKYR